MNNSPNRTNTHVWYYLHGMFDMQTGPVSERELVDLVKDGTIKPKTKIFSPTRTQNTIVYADSVSGIQKIFEQMATAKAQLEEQEKAAEAERLAKERTELKERLDAKAAAKRAKKLPPQLISKNIVEQEREESTEPGVRPGQTIIIQQAGFHPQRLIILIASIAALAGVFLPWYHFPLGSISGSSGPDGWIVFGFLIPTALATIMPDLTTKIPIWRAILCSATLLVPIGYCGWRLGVYFYEQSQPKGSRFEEAMSDFLMVGPGLYVILFASLVSFGFLLSFPESKPKTIRVEG